MKSKKCSKGLGKFMYCCAKKLTFVISSPYLFKVDYYERKHSILSRMFFYFQLSQDGKNLDDGKLEQWIESKMQGQGKEVLMQIVTDCHSKEYKPDLPPEKAMCGLAICCLEHIQKAQG